MDMKESLYLPFRMAVEIVLEPSMAESVRIHVLETWFATPFAIIFLVEISVTSTNSRPNTTHFGESICVILYTYNKFAAKEGT